MKLIQTARKLLEQNSPAWLNVELNRDFCQNFQAAIAPSEVVRGRGSARHTSAQPVPVVRETSPQENLSLQGRPHWRRISQVYQVLDRCWSDQGATTYTVLMTHVQEATGVKCSKKLISKWKLERKLRCGPR